MKELIEKSNLKLNSPTKSTHSNDDTSSSQSIKSNLSCYALFLC